VLGCPVTKPGPPASIKQENGRVPQDHPYYRADLAFVFDQGFGFHAQRCAPGVLALLEPVRQAGGVEVLNE
jgi:hypothetical protein